MIISMKIDTDPVLELKNVTKTFGNLAAVDSVNFDLKASEIHAVLGENGAGKSTLMNLIYGLYQPTDGNIYISGKIKQLKSPRDAISNGIGMVHQHFMLIENLTVAENIALSVSQFSSSDVLPKLDKTSTGFTSEEYTNQIKLSRFRYRKDEAMQITEAYSNRFGLSVDPNALVRTLSVGLKQRVEILKALAVDARILILDEPTAVLSPQEVDSFFDILRALQNDGKSIIFISHKMDEVLEISDRITILRRGKKVYNGRTGELTAKQLAGEMLGDEIPQVKRDQNEASNDVVLSISNLTVKGNRKEIAVADVSFDTYRGEIVGIAGVDGNGQRELAESIMGLRPIISGKIDILGNQPKGTNNIRQCSVGFIPEDRRTMGIISTFSVAENLMLNMPYLEDVSKWGVIDQKSKSENVKKLINTYDIRPPTSEIPASSLSGGNQQKIVVARELSPQPELLVAVNPTRGLDINAAQFVHQNLLKQRNRKKSVLLISTELDEVLLMSDRLYVMSMGKLIDATKLRDNIEALGLLMTGETNLDE